MKTVGQMLIAQIYLNAWAFWLANKARFQQEEMKGILDLFAIAID